MAFVRRYMIFIIVIVITVASAWLADVLTGPSAQMYANGSPQGLGWLISPFIRSCGPVGPVITFFGLWLGALALSAFVFVMMQPLRRVAPAQD